MRGKAISYRIHTPSGFSCLSIPYIGEQNMNIGGGRKIFEGGGGSLPPAALAIPAAVVPGGAASPRRHWLSLPLAYLLAPYPPNPLPRRGRGRLLVYFAGGYRPRHPGIKPLAALTEPPKQVPGGGVPSASPVRRKTDRIAFLSAMPAAKERGDRGRGTSAFEMVLSPGAGIAGAAGKSALRARAGGYPSPSGKGGKKSS